MTDHPDFTIEYALIIPQSADRQAEPSILLLACDGGWTLPQWATTESHFWQDVAHVNAWAEERLGLIVTVLRCVEIVDDFAGKRMLLLYELENQRADIAIAGMRWVSQAELGRYELVQPRQRQQIEQWFGQASQIQRTDVPWYNPGWRATADAWIAAELERLGLWLIAPIEQIRAWARSTVLRIPTNAGLLYFKALPAMFAHELALTHMLMAHEPGCSPKPVALDAQRRWMLMPDFGARSLNRVPDLALWEAAIRRFAELQIRWITRGGQLRDCGLPVRPLRHLVEQIDPLLAANDHMLPDKPWGMGEDEIRRLRGLAPQIKNLAAELGQFNLPDSLEHGDLWPTNIYLAGERDSERMIFSDWSDASIAPPFFSLLLWLDGADNTFGDDARDRLRDAYLQPWVEHLNQPAESIRRAYRLAELLAPLHYAVTYFRYIYPQMRTPWEMEGMLPFYLKLLLRGVEAGAA